MEKKKTRHLEKIHEMLEDTPVCEVIHRLKLCGCGSHEGKKEEQGKQESIARLTEYKEELSRELQRVEQRITQLKIKNE
ncbi:MAG: hypothetical protein PVI82_01595 [Desulfobacterales bacterium]|jgi:hypothetical protein